nr:MAG TPA: hypothetical protein [Bacteriophage sp.]
MSDLISKSRLKDELLKIPSEMGLIKKAWVIQAVNEQKTQDNNNNCNCQHNSNSRENEPCCRCDSRNTNADRIRNMPDKELAEFIQKMANTCLVDFMGYADKDCDKISCKDCEAKAPTILEWLQSEAE